MFMRVLHSQLFGAPFAAPEFERGIGSFCCFSDPPAPPKPRAPKTPPRARPKDSRKRRTSRPRFPAQGAAPPETQGAAPPETQGAAPSPAPQDGEDCDYVLLDPACAGASDAAGHEFVLL